MMSRYSKASHRFAIVAALVVGGALSGCSDIYYDRRETISLGADDAVATNKVTQMIDPWPPQSGNRHIPGNGDRVAGAVERYRMNKVTAPVGNGTSNTYTAAPAAADPAASAPPPAIK
jgi:hypothetical protein